MGIMLEEEDINRDLSGFIAEGATWSAGYVHPGDDVMLWVAIIRPPLPSVFSPVVFIPGLGSVMENFRDALREMSRTFDIYYVETREKRSSKVLRTHGFSVSELASDISALVEKAGFAGNGYILMGYSLGATTIIETFRYLPRKPLAMVLAEPNAAFGFPGWLLVLARFASPFYNLLKPFLKWYVRKFRVNTKEDYEMYSINCRILDAADPVKISATVRAIARYTAWDNLSSIDIPVLVAGASKDTFHNPEEAVMIARRIANSKYVDLVTNLQLHGAEISLCVEEFIGTLLRDK